MTRGSMPARREFAVVVVSCAVAAGLAVYAASRTWLLETVERAAPIPDLTTPRSGGSLVPALPALALVALAGAGALLATRGLARRVIGAVLAAAGVGVTLAVGTPLVTGELSGGSGRPGWAVLCVAAGGVVTVVGIVTLRRGPRWPSMGSRYERSVPGRGLDGVRDAGAAAPTTAAAGEDRAQSRLWDALDHGEDPTDDPEFRTGK